MSTFLDKTGLTYLWSKISSAFATKTEVEAKQDALTFDASPLAGSANPVESGGVYNVLLTKLDYNSGDIGEDYDTTELDNRVAYTSQTKTETQKAAARENIGAQEELTFDEIPTSDSTHPVKSGGVYSALLTKLDYNTSTVGEDYDTTELDNRVAYTSQSMTSAQQAVARNNIGAASADALAALEARIAALEG